MARPKAWWNKLTDDALDRTAGKFAILSGLLQGNYGYSRLNAANEIDMRVTDYEVGLKTKSKPVTTKKSHSPYSLLQREWDNSKYRK